METPSNLPSNAAGTTAASSSSTTKPATNPYARTSSGPKFVGGAEATRRKARILAKRPTATRILRPGELERKEGRQEEILPRGMNTSERFFASLLRSPAKDYLPDSETKQLALWKTICRRSGVVVPAAPIEPAYRTAPKHFDIRTALVLEESRHSLADSLTKYWKQPNRTKSLRIPMSLDYQELRKNGHTQLVFRKSTPFTKDELYEIRPGSVLQCLPRDAAQTIDAVILANVTTGSRDEVEKTKKFTVLAYGDSLSFRDGSEWILTPLTFLISELRQYEACSQARSVPFLFSLLGCKLAEHTRFAEAPQAQDETAAAIDLTGEDDDDDYLSGSCIENRFQVAALNDTQEQATMAFLESKERTITLVQGPPGTGKTTMLVSVICRYLTQSPSTNPRLMVCAPTNKAVTVLATRFLQACRGDLSICNAILVGDADKLLVEPGNNGVDSDLNSIFVYTWLPSLWKEYETLAKYCNGALPGMSAANAAAIAQRLYKRLVNSLPGLPSAIVNGANNLSPLISQVQPGQPAASQALAVLEKLIRDLRSMPLDTVWRELMGSANVIFCTLASAGSALVKSTNAIHDLIVDEAAAATEPELYIPFSHNPSRLLAVGDPLQLPATVMSRRAIELGLNKSLHERLMYDLEGDHVMLDVQYRMKPDISYFPSNRFYDGRIENGHNVKSPEYKGPINLLDGSPFTFLQVDGVEEQVVGGSYQNMEEARAVVDLVRQLQGGLKRLQRQYSVETVRVITFYQGQVRLLQRMLGNDGTVVATVDSSQGCEADIVIVSFVRSRGAGKLSAGFLADDRRVNVALTRAKFQLICVGNAQGMRTAPDAETLQLLVEDTSDRNCLKPWRSPRFATNRPNNRRGGKRGPNRNHPNQRAKQEHPQERRRNGGTHPKGNGPNKRRRRNKPNHRLNSDTTTGRSTKDGPVQGPRAQRPPVVNEKLV